MKTLTDLLEYVHPDAGPPGYGMPEKLRTVTSDDLREVIARGWFYSSDGKAWQNSQRHIDDIERQAIQEESEPDFKQRAAGER